MKRPEDDVNLSLGLGFMVDPGPYKEHLKVAIEIKEVQFFPLPLHGLSMRLIRCFERDRHVMNFMLSRMPTTCRTIQLIPESAQVLASATGAFVRIPS